MKAIMNDRQLETVKQVGEFLAGTEIVTMMVIVLSIDPSGAVLSSVECGVAMS